MELTFLAIMPGLLIWIAILLLPWRPWSTRESLDSQSTENLDLSDVTVLIPARNEAETISQTLSALKKQGTGLNVVLVDDQSTDNTVEQAHSANLDNLKIVSGTPLPEGWSGKLWAMEQGRQLIKTPYLLLLDADIALTPGLIPTLLNMAHENELKMLSLMAHLKMESSWEKLLMPAFIFFFKLLYPFHLSNKPDSSIAAAAGGCILLESNVLEKLGGFNCIKNALIDDCSLAKQIKQDGHKIWMGLTHSAISIRSYESLSTIWQMVTRTAYTQLAYSPSLLLVCTLLMVAAFGLPIAALFQTQIYLVITGLIILVLQIACYLPTLRYYSMNPLYSLSLPLIGILYLLMTWSSAFHYYFGKGAVWKDRHYN
jgi:hopene-associated glycosyltransferase HpnB